MTDTSTPLRCAECDCEKGGPDCNWIKAGPDTSAKAIEEFAQEAEQQEIQDANYLAAVLRALSAERDALAAEVAALKDALENSNALLADMDRTVEYSDEAFESMYLAAAQPQAVKLSDFRDAWQQHGGYWHGPRIETWTIPEANFCGFMREVLSAIHTQPASEVTVQEAATRLRQCDENGRRSAVYDACKNRCKVHKFDAVLNALADQEGE